MRFSSNLVENAVSSFAQLPGIGKRTALRLVLHLLKQPLEVTNQFATAIQKLRAEIKECQICHNLSDYELCSICNDNRRDNSIICVVESIRDVMAIEETNQFRGKYHVLGGLIAPIEGVGPAELNIQSLVKRVEDGAVKEIVMAISPTIEGDTTIYYISQKLKDKQVVVSSIARGVAFGGELEYADEITLGRSIVSRIPYSMGE
ncbi:MAG: recombination protein RecR [Saprospiraceae bacterium]|nr:recombination protein RecR [Saprospiraceae bacterium]